MCHMFHLCDTIPINPWISITSQRWHSNLLIPTSLYSLCCSYAYTSFFLLVSSSLFNIIGLYHYEHSFFPPGSFFPYIKAGRIWPNNGSRCLLPSLFFFLCDSFYIPLFSWSNRMLLTYQLLILTSSLLCA